jgi:cystathionine beta-lyase/cystathionine gamma-synthase
VIYVETMTNPLLEVPDVAAVVAFARQHALVSVVDNTFASPVNFRPLAAGFDLSLHSATKYLNGHSDLVAGAVIGKAATIGAIKRCLDHLGGALDPHACFLLQRGLKTLGVRVRRQNETALAVAQALEANRRVARVFYPGLPSHPQHARARQLFAGGGGVVSFELPGGAVAADRFIRRLTLPLHAPSLGGVESLVTCPGTTTHAGMPEAEKQAAGLSDGLVRLSVGLEEAGELIADLEQALAGS